MEQTQLLQYIAVLMLFALAVAATGGMIFFSVLLGKKGKGSKIKDTAYECGMIPIGPGGTRMSVKFYLVAMLFILFDIEVVFMYPWAVIFRRLGWFGLGEMAVFVAVLGVGLAYIWRVGALEWD
jgi:NADH-quinone oxidoreductase subunit A